MNKTKLVNIRTLKGDEKQTKYGRKKSNDMDFGRNVCTMWINVNTQEMACMNMAKNEKKQKRQFDACRRRKKKYLWEEKQKMCLHFTLKNIGGGNYDSDFVFTAPILFFISYSEKMLNQGILSSIDVNFYKFTSLVSENSLLALHDRTQNCIHCRYSQSNFVS